MILTRELIDNLKTEKGKCFTSETLKYLPVERPLVGGWTYRLVGKFIEEENYKKAFVGKTIFKGNHKKDENQIRLNF
jgi:hypothetical protein